MKNCPFCQLDLRVLIENELAVGFLSNPRKVKGHFLVTPRRHIESLNDLNYQELTSCFELIRKIEALLLADGAEGCDIRQNYRPFLKQGRIKVDHLHFHVLPRSFEDELYQKVEKYETEFFIDLPNNEASYYQKLL